MKKTYIFFLLAAGCMLTTGCSNEYSEKAPEPSVQYLNIAVSVPETGSPTRAVDENEVKTIDIFFFDQADGKCATALHYDIGDDVSPTPDGKGKIWPGGVAGTTDGDKYIVAGVNLSGGMVLRMKSLICTQTGLAMFEHTLAELTEGSSGMVMFSRTAEPLGVNQFSDTEADARNATPYVINVDRSVAKMAVFADDNMTVTGGGSYENLLFGWANVNKKLSYIPRITITGADPYEWANLEKYTPEPVVPFYDEGDTPTLFAYAQENLMPYTPGMENKLTCLRITGGYIPENYSYLDGNKISQTANTDISAETFYTLESTNGDLYYFDTEAKAVEALIAAGTGLVPLFKTNVGEGGLLTYTDGKCYFDTLINHSPADEKKHNIVRNTYYKITVNSIKAPGLPAADPGSGPEPEQWINFSVKVLDWTDVEEDIDI